MKTVDTCTFCAKKKLCMPTKPYYGWCQWRETEQTKGQTIERDAREATRTLWTRARSKYRTQTIERDAREATKRSESKC